MTIKKKLKMSNSIISTFKNNNYNIISALSEYIDNSTQSFFDNQKTLKESNGNPKIDIILELDSKTNRSSSISILDNSLGMTPNEMLSALDIGQTLTKSSRNEFGMGLKTSSFWFCSEWTLYSKKFGSNKTNYINLKEQEAVKDDYELQVKESSASSIFSYSSGTLILLEKFQKNRRISEASLRNLVSTISSHYRRDILKNNLEIRIAVKKDGKFKDLSIDENLLWKDSLSEIKPISWKNPIPSEKDGKKISKKFEIILHDEESEELKANVEILSMKIGDRKAAGITFIRNGRVVEGGYNAKLRPSIIFGNDTSFESLRIFVEVEVGNNWPVSQQKDRLLISDDLRNELYAEIKKQGKEILRFAKDQRSKAVIPLEKIIESSKEVNDKIAETINTSTFPESNFLHDETISINIEYVGGDYNSKWEIKWREKDKEFIYDVKTQLLTEEKDNNSKWLEFEKDSETEFTFKMNIAHRFFTPYTDDAKYLQLLQRMMFYILFAEAIANINYERKGIFIESNTIRNFINKLFENDIK